MERHLQLASQFVFILNLVGIEMFEQPLYSCQDQTYCDVIFVLRTVHFIYREIKCGFYAKCGSH